MVVDDMRTQNEKPNEFITSHAETFTCARCGQTYISRGIADPGNLCIPCERELNARSKPVVGGPLDGEVIK